MRIPVAIACTLMTIASQAHASQEPATKEEFESLISAPFKATHLKNNSIVEVTLKADGSAVARQSYNDIGTWRRDGDSGYCVRWNKSRFDDRCAYLTKRDGKFAFGPQLGDPVWQVEPLK